MADINSPLDLLKMAMMVNGTYPIRGHRKLFLIIAATNIFMSIFLLISVLIRLKLSSNFLEDGLEAFQFFCSTFHIFMKTITYLVKMDRIVALFEDIESIWHEFAQNEMNHPILVKGKQKAVLNSKIILTLISSAVPLQTVNVLVVNWLYGTDNLPFQMWVPLSGYVAPATIQFIDCVAVGYFLGSCTCFFRHVSITICTLIAVLNKRLATSTPEERRQYIILHQKILKVTGELNKIYSGQLALEVLSTSILTCVRGYYLQKAVEKYDLNAIANLYIFALCLLTPYLICSNGSIILEESNKLFRSIYFSKWYEEGIESRKQLIFMQEMAKRGIMMNYRKLITFDMTRYASVVQASFSYLTLLKSFDV